MTTVNGTLGIPADDIATMLGMVAKAAVSAIDYLPPFASIGVTDKGHAVLHVFYIDADIYQPQGERGDRIHVEAQSVGAQMHIVARPGETLTDLASAAVDFLSTESPVPA